MNLLIAPDDVIIIIMEHLSPRDLGYLLRTCSRLYHLVEEFGWRNYVKNHPRDLYSLSRTFSLWSARAQVRYNIISDHRWSSSEFVARPLSQPWTGKLQPLLSINSSRLLLAAGNMIYSYGLDSSTDQELAPRVHSECTYTTSAFHPNRDITGLACVPDDGLDRTVYLGYADGSIERVTLPSSEELNQSSAIDASLRQRFDFHDDLIESISASRTHLLSVSSAGTVAYLPLSSEDPTPELLNIEARSWCSHLSPYPSAPYAVFGTSSQTPLSLHTIYPTHFSRTPSAILEPSAKIPKRVSAVYAITSAPPSFPWGASDQIIISGWYDGMVRVHDLRSPCRSTPSNDGAPSLLPVLSFADPWSYEPIYSLGCGGGSSAHVAAGSARHSVLAFWDVRAPLKGWSVHAPGNDSSPVYSVVVDGSRVFGATQSRGFVLDFGPGVTETTYPPVTFNPTPQRRQNRSRRGWDDEGLRFNSAIGPGFYVTSYTHSR